MKRTPLARRTPLTSTTQLRRTPLAAVSAKAKLAAPKPRKRPTPAVPVNIRTALRTRSGGVCEIRLHLCAGQATDPHHRITQKAGGRKGAAKTTHDRLSNLLDACRACHQYVSVNPFEAYENGWSCKEGSATAAEPVLYRGRLVFLSDDGQVLPYRTAVAA